MRAFWDNNRYGVGDEIDGGGRGWWIWVNTAVPDRADGNAFFTLIHEMAHWVHDNYGGASESSHNPTFKAVLVLMWRLLLGDKAATHLLLGYADNQSRVSLANKTRLAEHWRWDVAPLVKEAKKL